ncbi:MAG TPA: NosD domain-containing protein [Kofleriaceae bacterium]
MTSMRSALVMALGLTACASSGGITDHPPGTTDPDFGSYPGAEPDVAAPLVIDGLEPGWLVTTTTLADGRMPVDATVVSDGSPITVAATDGTRAFAAVTGGDGAVIATQTVLAACSPRSPQLHVPAQYPTIQAAVNAAHPGDTITVAPGRYTETVIMKQGVCLLGSGASRTILDGRGEARTLVDLSIAPGSTVSGFTFRGTTGNGGCATDDVYQCSGNWYRAGIFVSGEGLGGEVPGYDPAQKWSGPSQKSPALIYGNLFEDNDIGVMLNYHGIGVVRNNVFVGNRSALVANHFDDHTLVANNVFIDNAQLAIGNDAAYLDIIANAIVGSDVAIHFQYIQNGAIRCNLFFHNGADQTDLFDVPPRFTIGKDGNLDVDPRFANLDPRIAGASDYHLAPGSPGVDRGCFGDHEPDGTPYDLGVYGGPLGQSISL